MTNLQTFNIFFILPQKKKKTISLLFAETTFDINSCTVNGTDPLKPKCPVLDENQTPAFPEWLTIIMLCVYLLFANILLLNLLIAIFKWVLFNIILCFVMIVFKWDFHCCNCKYFSWCIVVLTTWSSVLIAIFLQLYLPGSAGQHRQNMEVSKIWAN